MEERGDPPEEEIEALVRALIPVQERLRPAAATLMLAARVRMEEQSDQDDVYYKMRAKLADPLLLLSDARSRWRRAFLYWEILRELQQKLDTKEITGDAWAMIVKTNANNLAAVLDELGRAEEGARWMKLAVVAGSAARRLGADNNPVDESTYFGLARFFRDFGDARVTPEWAALLDDMGNVSGVWKTRSAWEDASKIDKILASDLDTWLVEMGAAVARCGVGNPAERPRKVVATLFNAGVTVIRGTRSSREWKYAQECRITLNGAGLLWVLAQRTGDDLDSFRAALRTHGGAECAVNLVATLADLGVPDAAREILPRFAGVLDELSPAIPIDFQLRIRDSLRRLDIKPQAEKGNPVEVLSALVAACLPEGEWQNAWLRFAESPDSVTLGALLAETAKAGHADYARGLKRLTGVLSDLEEKGRQWPEFFLKMKMDDLPPEIAKVQGEVERIRSEGLPFPDRLAAMANILIYG